MVRMKTAETWMGREEECGREEAPAATTWSGTGGAPRRRSNAGRPGAQEREAAGPSIDGMVGGTVEPSDGRLTFGGFWHQARQRPPNKITCSNNIKARSSHIRQPRSSRVPPPRPQPPQRRASHAHLRAVRAE